MFDSFASYLSDKGHLTTEELKQVELVAMPRKIRRHQYLLQAEDRSNYIGFVVKGCLRQFRVDENGQEHIMRFFIEDWWATDYESFHTGRPSKYEIEALENSELLMIEKDDFEKLNETIPNFKSMIDRLGAKNFEVHQARIYSSISESAEVRYTNFVKSYPAIFERVPQHMIASFLGVSRETISRLRKQKSK